MELVGAVEYLSDIVYLEQGGASALSETAAQVCNLVLVADVALLSQHPYGGDEEIFRRGVLLLVDGKYSVTQVELPLHLFLVAYREDGCRAAE